MNYNKNYSLDINISSICQNEYNYFLNKKYVVGVSLGYKITGGFYTFKKCITIFVVKKLSLNNLSKENIVPKYYKGILTDIVESGPLRFNSLTSRVRPVIQGYSIGNESSLECGTCGCLVTNGVLKFLLSTNHTIANENLLPLGSPIIQPANKYGGFHPNDTIGTLHKFITLRFVEGEREPINFSDCAIGLLSNPNILSPKITYIGKLKGVKSPILNEDVKKVGATTELTHGNILNTDGITTTTFASGKTCLFQNLIFTTHMTERGDSGCILVNKYNYGLGMGFAGTDDLSIFCNLKIVLDQLDVHLIT